MTSNEETTIKKFNEKEKTKLLSKLSEYYIKEEFNDNYDLIKPIVSGYYQDYLKVKNIFSKIYIK